MYNPVFLLPLLVKVFDVFLNEHHIIPDLDIFAKVGRAAAYDEVVPFSIKDGTLHVGMETSAFDGTLTLEFAKVHCTCMLYMTVDLQ